MVRDWYKPKLMEIANQTMTTAGNTIANQVTTSCFDTLPPSTNGK